MAAMKGGWPSEKVVTPKSVHQQQQVATMNQTMKFSPVQEGDVFCPLVQQSVRLACQEQYVSGIGQDEPVISRDVACDLERTCAHAHDPKCPANRLRRGG
jgi:hypothetical protein